MGCSQREQSPSSCQRHSLPCKPLLFYHPQVKIEKEKVYIRASKQVRGHWHPRIKPRAFSFCSVCVRVEGNAFLLVLRQGKQCLNRRMHKHPTWVNQRSTQPGPVSSSSLYRGTSGAGQRWCVSLPAPCSCRYLSRGVHGSSSYWVFVLDLFVFPYTHSNV